MPVSFQKFKDIFKDDVVVKKLEINYRSTVQILDVANTLINKRKTDFSKNLVSSCPDRIGEKAKLFIANSEEAKANKLVKIILEISKKTYL